MSLLDIKSKDFILRSADGEVACFFLFDQELIVLWTSVRNFEDRFAFEFTKINNDAIFLDNARKRTLLLCHDSLLRMLGQVECLMS